MLNKVILSKTAKLKYNDDKINKSIDIITSALKRLPFKNCVTKICLDVRSDPITRLTGFPAQIYIAFKDKSTNKEMDFSYMLYHHDVLQQRDFYNNLLSIFIKLKLCYSL